jgi:type I restriction enzyme M protein
MALKKSELYSSLWKSCDELRGSMDASQYKDYVLVLLFMKYVSDKYAGQKDALLDVPKGGSFSDMVALKGDKEIGEKINKIISKLAEANNLKGVIDVADFNNEDKLGKAKDMVGRLSNLIAIFEGLDFGRNRAEGDDLLGDAYEYLMRNFATESGKSKGQFYTPSEVSRIMAKVIGLDAAKSNTQSIYDPTCGSGSLLLKAHDEAKGNTGLDLAIYGQEMDNATSALAKMNMYLHDCPTAEIWQDNTLSSPHFKQPNGQLKTHDFVVANPPFSTKAWSTGFHPENDEYGRFSFGVPPEKNGDYAFLLHILASLKSTGKGAVILPHGVLFRGNAEANIRRAVIQHGYIKGIISLPANLFFGTGIPACIIVMDKEHAQARKGIFMVDASKGFIKDGNKNRLRAQDIHRIVDTFTRQIEIPRYSRMVPLAEISAPKNDFNLNIPRYIDSTEPEDIQDIDAHLRGGIPNRDIDALERYWDVFPAIRSALFKKADRPGYCHLKPPVSDLKATIFDHLEYTAFNETVTALFSKWKKTNTPVLKAIKVGDKPKALIESLSENLLDTFRKGPLVDAYDVYQHLMDYWAETMQDDVYLLVQEEWKADSELIPPALIIARFFSKEQAAIEQLEADRDAITREMEEMDEEHGGEDGLLADAKTDKGKLTTKSIKDYLKSLRSSPSVKSVASEELTLLEKYLELIDQEAEGNRKIKAAQKALDTKVTAKYSQLAEAEIKTLVVDDKWLTMLAATVQSELDRISQALTARIRLLSDRYAAPLPQITEEISTLAALVEKHLKKMGVVWK